MWQLLISHLSPLSFKAETKGKRMLNFTCISNHFILLGLEISLVSHPFNLLQLMSNQTSLLLEIHSEAIQCISVYHQIKVQLNTNIFFRNFLIAAMSSPHSSIPIRKEIIAVIVSTSENCHCY